MAGQINTVMQTCFFALAGVLPRDEAIEAIKKAIKKTYGRKGDAVVAKNHAAVDASLAALPAAGTNAAVSSPAPDDSALSWDRRGVALFDRKRRTTEYKAADSGYVSAWYLDEDYDGDCFVDCQMFFDFKKAPNIKAALRAVARRFGHLTLDPLRKMDDRACEAELLALPQIGGEGDDFGAIGGLQPLQDHRGIEAA